MLINHISLHCKLLHSEIKLDICVVVLNEGEMVGRDGRVVIFILLFLGQCNHGKSDGKSSITFVLSCIFLYN